VKSEDASKSIEELQAEVKRLREWHKQRSSYDVHPAQNLNEWRLYERMPFQISANTVVMIQLFKHNSSFIDSMWIDDMVDSQRRCHETLYKLAAEQFHKQLEGHDCIAFWQALRDEATKVIQEWEEAKLSV